MATIVVILAYCAWRIQATNDQIGRHEQMFARILENQATILNNQREHSDILRKYR